MRVTREASFPQVYASMTRKQQDSTDKLLLSLQEVEKVQRELGTAKAIYYSRVFDALEKGVPSRILASALGISVSKVYAIRDEVESHRDRWRKAAKE